MIIADLFLMLAIGLVTGCMIGYNMGARWGAWRYGWKR